MKIFDISTNKILTKVSKIRTQKVQPKVLPPLKVQTYRIKCSSTEKTILKKWFGCKRWTYNKCVDMLKKQNYSYNNINNKELRKSHINNCNFKEGGQYETSPWLLDVNYDIRDDGMRDFMKAFKNEKQKQKNNPRYTFKMQFQSRKMKSQSVTIRKRQYNSNSKTFGFLKHIKCNERLPKTIKYDMRIVMKHTGEIYLAIPVGLNMKSDNQAPNYLNHMQGVISLDPGVRTFVTGIDCDGSVFEWGKNDMGRIVRLCYHMDKLQSKISDKTITHGARQRCRKSWKKMITKIRNLVDDMHKKLSKWLCENFSVVLLPKFDVSHMVKKRKRNIHSKTARQMLTWSHYRFRQRLLNKCREYPWCNVIICDESYTSKTCCCCGLLNSKLGGSKVFRCIDKDTCGLVIGRDDNGALNILLRYLTLQYDKMCLIIDNIKQAKCV
jgi:putative transposase